MEMLNRTNPDYVKAVVEKKSQADPKETAIREKIRQAVLREEWARGAFSHIGKLQIAYLKEMVANVGNPELIHDKTQVVLKEISTQLKSQIVEGADTLADIPKGSPVLIMTNHFGVYKLTAVRPKEDLGVDIPDYDAMYPYPMYFAAIHPVASAIGNNLYLVSEDYPLIFGRIHTEAGFVHAPPASIETKGGKTILLQEQTQNAIHKRRNAAFVNFPEGGTSGKYTGMGPYDLSPFKTGGYVVAANLGIHVVPVAQYFDKDEGFQLKLLNPFIPAVSDKGGYERIAEENRIEMQDWLNERKDG